MFPGHSLRHSSPAMNIIKEEPSDFEPMNMDSYYEALSSSPPPSCIPQPDTNSLPFRAKRATVEMRAMMSVFRLDPFAKARGEPSPSKPPGPLEHEPEIIRFQLDPTIHHGWRHEADAGSSHHKSEYLSDASALLKYKMEAESLHRMSPDSTDESDYDPVYLSAQHPAEVEVHEDNFEQSSTSATDAEQDSPPQFAASLDFDHGSGPLDIYHHCDSQDYSDHAYATSSYTLGIDLHHRLGYPHSFPSSPPPKLTSEVHFDEDYLSTSHYVYYEQSYYRSEDYIGYTPLNPAVTTQSVGGHRRWSLPNSYQPLSCSSRIF